MQPFSKLIVAAVVVTMGTMSAQGRATVNIDSNTTLSVGLRLQVLALSTEEDVAGEGTFDRTEDAKVRRARLILKSTYDDWAIGFLQTDASSSDSGLDAKVIDAYAQLKPRPWTQLLAGQHLAAANRQNLVSTGGLLAPLPGLTYKSLTWGMRSVYQFATTTFSDCDSGLRGDGGVRDQGFTLFGSGSFSDTLHGKYYAGAYDGLNADGSDTLRYTGRVQLNVFDAEPGYYVKSTYLGKKKTLALGASVDTQDEIARMSEEETFDYRYYTLDSFAEWPIGPGSLTAEAAYMQLDLDDADARIDSAGEPTNNPLQAQGDGVYVQAGYAIERIQPWVAYETWNSDAEGGLGSYDMVRIGASYFFDGHRANIKAGWEHFSADNPIGESREDSVDTIFMGLYLDY